ncbi:MAG TPA: SPOR domain-containing protein [Kiloniellales bacterium]
MRTRHNRGWLAAAALAVGLVLAAPASVLAGFEEGSAAYQQGDYAKALEEWTPLAKNGNQQAQYNIGYMHFNGIGVPKEPAKAAKWFAMAAKQGDAAAQMSLGVMYGTGQGVEQDYSQAYIWLTLAAARLPYGDDRDQAVKNRDIVSAKMSRAQITDALGQALNWTPKSENGASVQAASTSVPPVAPAAPAAPANGGGTKPGAQIAAANGTSSAAPSPPAPSPSEAEIAAAKAAEAKAMEEAKAAAEAKSMEEAKAAAEAKAMAEAKAAAEAQAMAEAKAAAEAKAMEEAKAVAEAQAMAEAKAATKAAAEAQAAAPPTQTAALTAGTGFLVQLAALRSMSAAESEWSRLKRRHADILGQFEPVLQPVDLGSKGNFVRVQIGPFADTNEAGAVCQALRAQKQDCVVVSAARRG